MPIHALSVSAEKAKEDPYYVGMEKCNEYHPEYVKTYFGWKYSRNFRILELGEMDYNGAIEMESEARKGTTFKITFPVCEE